MRSETPVDRQSKCVTDVSVTAASRVVAALPEPIKVSPIQVAVPAVNAIIMDEPVIPIRRYYGRKRDNQTSSEDDGDDSVTETQDDNNR